jgi:hypothetical protein
MKDMSLSAEERRFVDALVEYFPQGTLFEPVTVSESLLERLESLSDEYFSNEENVGKPDFELKYMVGPFDIHMSILGLVGGQRQRWSLVCESYARLKVKAGERK